MDGRVQGCGGEVGSRDSFDKWLHKHYLSWEESKRKIDNKLHELKARKYDLYQASGGCTRRESDHDRESGYGSLKSSLKSVEAHASGNFNEQEEKLRDEADILEHPSQAYASYRNEMMEKDVEDLGKAIAKREDLLKPRGYLNNGTIPWNFSIEDPLHDYEHYMSQTYPSWHADSINAKGVSILKLCEGMEKEWKNGRKGLRMMEQDIVVAKHAQDAERELMLMREYHKRFCHELGLRWRRQHLEAEEMYLEDYHFVHEENRRFYRDSFDRFKAESRRRIDRHTAKRTVGERLGDIYTVNQIDQIPMSISWEKEGKGYLSQLYGNDNEDSISKKQSDEASSEDSMSIVDDIIVSEGDGTELMQDSDLVRRVKEEVQGLSKLYGSAHLHESKKSFSQSSIKSDKNLWASHSVDSKGKSENPTGPENAVSRVTNNPRDDYSIVARYHYTPKAEDELEIHPGDKMKFIEAFNEHWWKVELEKTGAWGLVPVSYMHFVDEIEFRNHYAPFRERDPNNVQRKSDNFDALSISSSSTLCSDVPDKKNRLRKTSLQGEAVAYCIETLSKDQKLLVLRKLIRIIESRPGQAGEIARKAYKKSNMSGTQMGLSDEKICAVIKHCLYSDEDTFSLESYGKTLKLLVQLYPGGLIPPYFCKSYLQLHERYDEDVLKKSIKSHHACEFWNMLMQHLCNMCAHSPKETLSLICSIFSPLLIQLSADEMKSFKDREITNPSIRNKLCALYAFGVTRNEEIERIEHENIEGPNTKVARIPITSQIPIGVRVEKKKRWDGSFGFFVSRIDPNSIASKIPKVKVGDEILEINRELLSEMHTSASVYSLMDEPQDDLVLVLQAPLEDKTQENPLLDKNGKLKKLEKILCAPKLEYLHVLLETCRSLKKPGKGIVDLAKAIVCIFCSNGMGLELAEVCIAWAVSVYSYEDIATDKEPRRSSRNSSPSRHLDHDRSPVRSSSPYISNDGRRSSSPYGSNTYRHSSAMSHTTTRSLSVRYSFAEENDLHRVNNVLRKNDLSTFVVSEYAKLVSQKYFEHILKPMVDAVSSAPQDFEINPHLVNLSGSVKSIRKDNITRIADGVQLLVDTVVTSVDNVPIAIRLLCRHLYGISITRMNDRQEKAVSNFFFLRYICCALCRPFNYGIADEIPGDDVVRSLRLIAGIFQHIVEGEFYDPQRTPHLYCFNSIIESSIGEIKGFINRLIFIPDHDILSKKAGSVEKVSYPESDLQPALQIVEQFTKVHIRRILHNLKSKNDIDDKGEFGPMTPGSLYNRIYRFIEQVLIERIILTRSQTYPQTSQQKKFSLRQQKVVQKYKTPSLLRRASSNISKIFKKEKHYDGAIEITDEMEAPYLVVE